MHIEIKNCFSFFGNFVPQAPYRGFVPGPRWGDFCPPDPLHRTSLHILYQVYAPAYM